MAIAATAVEMASSLNFGRPTHRSYRSFASHVHHTCIALRDARASTWRQGKSRKSGVFCRIWGFFWSPRGRHARAILGCVAADPRSISRFRSFPTPFASKMMVSGPSGPAPAISCCFRPSPADSGRLWAASGSLRGQPPASTVSPPPVSPVSSWAPCG